MSKKIAVIGSGISGLATAVRLSSVGYEVEIFERLSSCGGRNNLLQDNGFKFDMGPSFILMPDFLEEIFSYCGENLKEYLDLKELEVNYKIFYPDIDTFTVYKDTARTKEELEKIERGSSRAYDKFKKEVIRIYNKARPLFYRGLEPQVSKNPYYWFLAYDLKACQTYWQLARKFFKSDKLCYAFTFKSMFIGGSPIETPAFYSGVNYSDLVQKLYYPVGGMYQITSALRKMAEKYKVKFNYETEVNKIKDNQSSLSLAVGDKEIDFDKVVASADYPYVQTELLGRDIPDYGYACSAYLIYLGLKRKIRGFQHHNVFLSKDSDRNQSRIFSGEVLSEDPFFYVDVPTITDLSLAPEGKDLFRILVPVPNLKNPKGNMLGFKEGIRRAVFDKIARFTGLPLDDLIEVEYHFYPQDFIGRYNVKYGSAFGLMHNFKQSTCFRPLNFDPQIKGLYYTGASTQPGGGLPLVLAGSKIVADMISRKNTRKN